MSISVTRSIVPFLSIPLSPPKRAICTSPARSTASTAVARKMGSGASGTGGELLDHPHFHTAFRRSLQRHIVHEAGHEKDAAAAGLQEVLGRERIGDFLGVEPFALIEHADDELLGLGDRREREL